MSDIVYNILDYETRSEADLAEVGACEYAKHPSTRILCVAWSTGTREQFENGDFKIRWWSPAFSRRPPPEFLEAFTLADLNGAHNALFEQMVTKYVLPRYLDPNAHAFDLECFRTQTARSWFCTAALASTVALPRKLEHACPAVKLEHQKDMPGHRLMLKLSKPRRPTKNNPSKWHNSMSDLKRVIEYCAADLRAEISLWLKLPALTKLEREIWLLDQEVNQRGFYVDRPLIQKILGHVEEEVDNFNKELYALTAGEVETVNQTAKLKAFLESQGCKLPNVQAKTVRDVLANPGIEQSPVVRRALELRQMGAKSSTKKYYKMESYSRSDSRVRDLLMYHGASTGRWTGTGVQIQNFPRGTIYAPDMPFVAEQLPGLDLEQIRLLYGEPMNLFSSVLRSCIKATPGFEIFCGDYAAIEVRVLFWLAGHDGGLEIYRRGQDIYRVMASVVYKVDLDSVTKEQREIGKRIILGCGYGMGWVKFKATCEQFDVYIDAALAKTSVSAYREYHEPIPTFWRDLERAAIAAVVNKGKVFKTNRTRWFVKGDYLWCELPSGRRLAYYGPAVRMEPTPWGMRAPKLYHWGVHPKTKKWVFDSTYGGRLVENVTQAVARDVMAQAGLRVRAKNYLMLFSVHDELANERELGKGSLEEYTNLMSAVPDWADGLPLKVETWQGSRYRK